MPDPRFKIPPAVKCGSQIPLGDGWLECPGDCDVCEERAKGESLGASEADSIPKREEERDV